MSNDLIKKIQNQVRSNITADNSRYFLMKVDKIRVNEKDNKVFRAYGRRIDTNQIVAVDSIKSSSGQHLPEVGGIMRADKASRMPTTNPDLAYYKAEYFHAYADGSFCMAGLVRANRIYERDGRYLASCDIMDVEGVQSLVTGPDEFDAEILKQLKPWLREAGPLKFDAAGRNIWEALPVIGVTPVAHVRINGTDGIVEKGSFFGMGLIDENKTGTGKPIIRFPTDDEIMAQVRRNPQYEALKNVTYDSDFKQVGFVVIPALRINVGREALSDKEHYLGAPKSWESVRHDLPAINGVQPTQRGWRGGALHVKKTAKGALIVVDAAPTAEYKLSLTPPISQFEFKLAAQSENQTQTETQSQSQAAQPTVTAVATPVVETRQQPVVQQINQPSQPTNQSVSDDHFDDFEYSQEDLAAMEGMNDLAGFQDDSDFDIDSMLNEAAQRQSARFRM